MENSIFRKKSLERIASPEQLNDYIKVTNPSVWILLGSIIVLLLGVVIWAVFGQLATTVSAVVLVEDGIATCNVREADAASVAPGDAVYIGGETYALESVSAEPVQASAVLDAYALHVGELQDGEWTYPAALSASIPDGVYAVSIVTERISPISFVVN